MAVVNKLSISFVTETGTTSMNFKYVKSNVTAANVKALISAIIANNSIYVKQPLAAKSAKLVQTDETAIDISE